MAYPAVVLMDLDRLDRDRVDATVGVIGAGVAGLTIATRLAASGVDVVVLDAGGHEPAADSGAVAAPDGLTYPPVGDTRSRRFGGTSWRWGIDDGAWARGRGQFRPLEPRDFGPRDWIEGSGWPITHASLAAHYDQACELVGLGTDRFDIDHWDPDGSRRLPLDPTVVETVVFHLGSSEVFRRDLVDRAIADPAIAVAGHATVTGVDLDPSGRHVTAVRVATGQRRAVTARADRWVVATGGIENARLLLEMTAEAGAPDRWPALGRRFMERVQGSAGLIEPTDAFLDRVDHYQLVEHDDVTWSKWQVALGEDLLASERLGGMALGFYPTEPDWQPDDLNEIGRRLQARLGSRRGSGSGDGALYAVSFQAEQVPNPESRITLTDRRDAVGNRLPMLRWHLDDRDRRLYPRTTELLADILGDAGLGTLHQRRHDGDPAEPFLAPRWEGWATPTPVTHHHMGTTVMHDDPDRGVVDADGRCHGLSNLYVAGSSVFPTSGYANPTLTIVALALRLADHLAG